MAKFADHLREINACAPARRWAGDRTAQQAWAECPRPDWLIWWVLTDQPAMRQRMILLEVRELRARTLDRAGDLRAVSEAALDAAEAWALDPTEENRSRAFCAAAAASSSSSATFSESAAADSAAAAAAAAAAESADFATFSAAAAAAAADDSAAFAAADFADSAESADFADFAAAFAAAAAAAESALWLSVIRAEFTCPWKER